jgi:hypothetical protein
MLGGKLEDPTTINYFPLQTLQGPSLDDAGASVFLMLEHHGKVQ